MADTRHSEPSQGRCLTSNSSSSRDALPLRRGRPHSEMYSAACQEDLPDSFKPHMILKPGVSSSVCPENGPNACAWTDSNRTLAHPQIVAAFESAETDSQHAATLWFSQLGREDVFDETAAYSRLAGEHGQIMRGLEPPELDYVGIQTGRSAKQVGFHYVDLS